MKFQLFAELALVVVAASSVTGCGGDSNAAQVPAKSKQSVQPTAGLGFVDGGDSMRFIPHDENLAVAVGRKPLETVEQPGISVSGSRGLQRSEVGAAGPLGE